jgi:hypothetical protein
MNDITNHHWCERMGLFSLAFAMVMVELTHRHYQ